MYEACSPPFSKHVVCKSFGVKISYKRRGNVMQIYSTSNFSIFGYFGGLGGCQTIIVYSQYTTFHRIFQHTTLRGVYV